MADPETDRLVGQDRCWPCTIVNGAIALLVAGIPILGGVVNGSTALIVGGTVWAVLVLGYATSRLVSRGYLPGSDIVAKRTGLHDRVGPGRESGGPGPGSGRDEERG